MSTLLYGRTTYTLTKRREKQLDSNCTRMLRVILNKSWNQHPTKQQLHGHLPPISKTIQIRPRYVGHCRRKNGEHISDVLLWTPLHRRAGLGRLARSYQQWLCTDTGYSLEDLQTIETNGEGESGKSMLTAHNDNYLYVCRGAACE